MSRSVRHLFARSATRRTRRGKGRLGLGERGWGPDQVGPLRLPLVGVISPFHLFIRIIASADLSLFYVLYILMNHKLDKSDPYGCRDRSAHITRISANPL